MSYESQNTLPKGIRLDAIYEFMELLGYERFRGRYPLRQRQVVDFGWFSERDYESCTGVNASVGRQDSSEPYVYTRTPSARSYHDLVQQNRTIREIRRRFGGDFTTDAGLNRCWSTKGMPVLPPRARGILRAYSRLNFSLGQTFIYRSSVSVAPERRKVTGIEWMDALNPMILANNLLLPFLTAALEDFFKSAFVALLRYSDRKESFFKGARLNSGQLARVSNRLITIEEALAESLPFQKVSMICEHFKVLDPELDLAGSLKRPYRRRRESLLQSLDTMVERRHSLIHQNTLTTDYSDSDVDHDIHNLKIAATRCVRRMISHYGWNISDFDLRD